MKKSQQVRVDAFRGWLMAAEFLTDSGESFLKMGEPKEAGIALCKARESVKRLRAHLDRVLPDCAGRTEFVQQLDGMDERIRRASRQRQS